MTAKLPTIFVQIASYRDPECQWTVKDLFEKAEHPERVTVGICWQCDPEADKDCFVIPSPRPKQTKVISVLPSEAEGVCWARAQVQTLFEDQDYVLMIDSHMRFIPGWDTKLIAELARCPSPKSFLSTYPPAYTPPNQLEPNPRPVVMRSKAFNEYGDIRFEGEYLGGTPPEEPLRGAFLAAGLLFAPGRFVREVPYDPYTYFGHEEITLAARAFTHGWDVYSSPGTFVYHYYNDPKKDEARPQHWKDRKDWTKFQKLSRQRYNYMLAGIAPEDKEALKEIERYGLGKARSLVEFEAFSGLDFKSKVASDRARKSQFIENLDSYRAKAVQAVPPAGLPFLTALEAGDFMPPFVMKDDTGKEREMHLFAGKPCIICMLPSSFENYMREFMELYRAQTAKFQELGVRIIFIAPVPAAEVAAFRQKHNIPQGVMADENRALSRALDNLERSHNRPISCSLDCNQRVVDLYNNSNAQNHMADLLRAAAKLKALTQQEPLRLPVSAPVLIVPDVLSKASCARIIDYWEKGAKYAGTIGSEGKEKINTEGKRRVDVDVRDRDFLTALDIEMSKRLFPEIRKVFALDVTCRERYKIGLYTSEDKGFYNLHRDTGVPALSYRRVSVSLLLNDDFDGGLLTMPEYGPHAAFKAPAGGAICFPSTVLHAVTPVTRGKRFVMVSFFHGDGEERWRKQHHAEVQRKYDPGEVGIFCRKTHEGLTYSENFYTRQGT